jgi:Protein of unknown function (DUF3383)
MPLSDIVTVNITSTTATPTQPGFGTPLIAAYHTVFSPRVQTYNYLTDLTSAGFLTNSPVYLAATKLLEQSPSVTQFKVGRRASEYTQTYTLTVEDTTAGDYYNFLIGGTACNVAAVSGNANATANAIANAINAAAPAGMNTCTATAGVVTVTALAGKLVDFQNDNSGTNPFMSKLYLKNTTADPGLTADLNAIYTADNNWYGLLLDSESAAEVANAAAWAEVNKRLFVFSSSDSAICNSADSTDIFTTLQTSAYTHTVPLFVGNEMLSYGGAGWMGNRFPFLPGSDTWAFKTIAGLAADPLNSTQIHAVENKDGSVYTSLAGLNITQFGKVSSGQWADIERFTDWLVANLQINVYGLLANNSKIPFTDGGIDAIRAVIMQVLQQGINQGGLAANPAPSVMVPTAASVSAANFNSRNLPNVNFTATLAGAIHSTVINGSLST